MALGTHSNRKTSHVEKRRWPAIEWSAYRHAQSVFVDVRALPRKPFTSLELWDPPSGCQWGGGRQLRDGGGGPWPPATPPLRWSTSSPGLLTSKERMTISRGDAAKFLWRGRGVDGAMISDRAKKMIHKMSSD